MGKPDRITVRNARIVYRHFVLGQDIEMIHQATGLGRQSIGNIIRAFTIMSYNYNRVVADYHRHVILESLEEEARHD